jgi:hypothetical protein
MTTSAKKKAMRLVGVRIPDSVYARLLKRVARARKRSNGEASVSIATVVRALLEEHS